MAYICSRCKKEIIGDEENYKILCEKCSKVNPLELLDELRNGIVFHADTPNGCSLLAVIKKGWWDRLEELCNHDGTLNSKSIKDYK